MIEKIFIWLGGEAALSKKLGSLFRHLIPPITAYLLSLGLAPELVDQLGQHLSVSAGIAGSIVVAIILSLREKAGRK